MEKFLLVLGGALRSAGIQVTFVVTESIGAWHDRPTAAGFDVITVLPSRWRSPRRRAFQLLNVLRPFDAVLLNHCAASQAIIGELPESCLVFTVLHNDEEMVYHTGLGNVARNDHIVCVGFKILSEAARRGAPTEKLVHIPHGIEVPRAFPKENCRGGPPLKIIFVGRIDHVQKGVLDIPAILAEAQRLGAHATLDIVGDGEPDLEKLRAEFARKLPELKVVFHGRQPNEEAIRLLAAADVFLMPSRFEGMPVALLETLAQGTVPVASRLPGVTDDVVTDGVTGILPELGDIGGFARAIVHLQDDATRHRMSRAAWQSAHDRFTTELMTRRYLDLLNRPRPKSLCPFDPPDRVGRRLFGRSWFFPTGLTKIVRTARKR
jgi:glycosyltransferase involved in cell wall biosynthesis